MTARTSARVAWSACGLALALLAGVYTAGVFLLGRLLDPATGDSALAVAAATLAVAALFQPLRRRVPAAGAIRLWIPLARLAADRPAQEQVGRAGHRGASRNASRVRTPQPLAPLGW